MRTNPYYPLSKWVISGLLQIMNGEAYDGDGQRPWGDMTQRLVDAISMHTQAVKSSRPREFGMRLWGQVSGMTSAEPVQ